MSRRKIFVLINPFSGGRKKSKTLSHLTEALKAENFDFEVFDTSKEKNATEVVSNSLDESFTDLIILGGDGTINEAINGLKYDVPFSILPCGTGNDFVKNFNLGSSKHEQILTAIHGQVKEIDLGMCNDRIFLNGVGIGFDGQIVEDMLHKRVPILKGHAAYYYHVLRILGSYKERKFDFEIDGNQFSKDLILLTVGNGTTFGGGFKLMPDAKVDDGKLQICEIGKLGPLRRFTNIHRLSNGSHDKLGEVNLVEAKSVRIEKNPLLFGHIDGEWLGQPPFDIKVLPSAAKIRVARF